MAVYQAQTNAGDGDRVVGIGLEHGHCLYAIDESVSLGWPLVACENVYMNKR